jgi:hypothetical protein
MPLSLVAKLKRDRCTRLSVDQWGGLSFRFAAYAIKPLARPRPGGVGRPGRVGGFCGAKQL